MNFNARIPALSVILVLVVAQFCCGQFKLPDTPPAGQLVQDYAGIISDIDKEEIRKFQYQAYEQFDTPIAVVTISSLAEFNASKNQIEKAAHDLFNKWQIGKRDSDDNLINQGILLLVSVKDRKARIELGADWGREWDSRCEIIMQHSIVKQCKAGNHSGGIRDGVEKLAVMGEAGPSGALSYTFTDNLDLPINSMSPLPKFWAYLICSIGLLLIFVGSAVPEFRIPMLLFGVGLILFSVFLDFVWWGILLLIALLGKGGGLGDGSASGGFDSGGFSGGGGATGSW